MAQLAIAALGAGIGSMFGYASLGWSIGSALGSALFPGKLPDVQGPRLDDLKVQNSSYGAMIPIVYGGVRIAGNVIWSTDLIESSQTTTSGGKGGGPEQSSTSYSYSISTAIALCEGPIIAVRKIWANGELVYNTDSAASAETTLASASGASSVTIYTGSETQLPDPTIESDKGVGNVPAYRGLAYVVFDGLQLEKFGNRLPNFTFEVLTAASASGFRRLTAVVNTGVPFALRPDPGPGYGNGIPAALMPAGGVLRIAKVLPNVRTETPVYLFNLDGLYLGKEERANGEVYPGLQGIFPQLVSYPVGIIDGRPVRLSDTYYQALSSSHNVLVVGIGPRAEGTQDASLDPLTGYELTNVLPSYVFADGDGFIQTVAMCADGMHAIIFVVRGPYPNYIRSWHLLRYNNGAATLLRSGTLDATVQSGFAAFSAGAYIGNSRSLRSGVCMLESDLQHVWTLDGAASGNVSCYSLDADNIMRQIGTLPANPGGNQGDAMPEWLDIYPTIWADKGLAFGFAGSSFASFSRLPGISQQAVTLSSITANLCSRAGLAGGDINVAALTDTVDGYVIANQMTARNAIEPLQQAFYFDAVESGNVIKFVKRGGASVATISSDDLAAHAYGDTMPDELPISRQQEVELPASVNVLYINRAMDYQQGTQQSKRITTQSQQATSLSVPIVLTDNKAKQVADVLIYDAWTQRTRYQPSVSRKHALIEPTDVVTVTKGAGTHTLRITKKDESRSGVIRLEAVAEHSSVYTQLAPGGTAPTPTSSIGIEGPTKLILLDIPLLRDQDNNAGFYAVARGYTSTWRGAVLYKSTDGGASYDTNVGSLTTAATIGYANTVLGNFSSGNIFDEHNTVDVTLLGGTLASTTELSVLNGANAAVLGSELIQYKNAVLIGTLKYRLSGLLRARKGTEWAMSTHAVSEQFVPLDAATLRRFLATNEINLLRNYKGVSIGTTIASAIAQSFAYAGVNLECLSPVLVGGGWDSSGNITIKWTRRTRLGSELVNFVDVPLGETTESYDVDIINGTSVVRRLTVSTPTAAYTDVMQVADFGGPQNTITIRVYQKSSTVGRGYGAQATISKNSAVTGVIFLPIEAAPIIVPPPTEEVPPIVPTPEPTPAPLPTDPPAAVILPIYPSLWDGSQFVAIEGNGGPVWTSPSSAVWTRHSSNVNVGTTGSSIVFGNGIYVVPASTGKFISTSTNLDNFNATPLSTFLPGASGNEEMGPIIFDGAKFVSIGKDGTAAAIFTSTTGTTWSKLSVSGFSGSAQFSLLSLAFDGTNYLAIGVIRTTDTTYAGYGKDVSKIYTSSNLTSWTDRSASHVDGNLLDSVGGNAGTWICVGGKLDSLKRRLPWIIRSINVGVSWTDVSPTSSVADRALNDVFRFSGNWVATGGTRSGTNPGGFGATSTDDGVTWTPNYPSLGHGYGVVASPTLLLSSQEPLDKSSDGSTWSLI